MLNLHDHNVADHARNGRARKPAPAPRLARDAARGPVNHVLVAVRLHNDERDAVLMALQMAAQQGARVTLLHVLAPFARSSVHWGDAIDNLHLALSGRPRDLLSAVESGRAEITAFLNREIPRELLDSLEVDVDCRVGDVAQEVARYADHQNADLIFLCDRSRWRPRLVASLSQRIERLSSKPIVFGRSRKPQGNGSTR